MAWTAVVRKIIDQQIQFCQDDKLQLTPSISIFVVMQISMSVKIVTWTIVMEMHSVLTLKGVSSAPATRVILEMGSTVQVRYSTNKYYYLFFH